MYDTSINHDIWAMLLMLYDTDVAPASPKAVAI